MVRKLGQKRVLGTLVGVIAVSVVIAFMWSACGKKSSDDPVATATTTTTSTTTDTSEEASTDVTIAGKLNLTGSYLVGYNLTSYNLYCVTFEDPPTAAKGDADTEGAFSLTLADAKDKAFGCFVREGNTTIATLTFEDTSSKGLDGSTLKSGSISLAGSADFGTITVDLAKGTAVVDIADIKDDFSDADEGEVFDPSGDWIVEALSESDLPDGYVGPCASYDNCHGGPVAGQHIYMKRISAKSFTPDAACQAAVDANTFDGANDTCNGTAGSDTQYGLMVWASEAAFNACGGVLGMTEQDGRARGNVTFEGSDFTTGAFTWSSEVTVDSVTYHLTDGWKATEATSLYDISNCSYNETTGHWDCSGEVASTGDLCSGITAGELWKMKCYANFYQNRFQSVIRSSEEICLNNKNFNWGATTVDDFDRNMGMTRAGLLYLMNGMVYAGPNAVTIKNQNNRTEGYDSTDNGYNVWKTCPLSEDETITITKISSTEAIIDMQMITKLGSTEDTGCAAGMANRLGESRSMAKMVRP